jgi:hypothetical protein
MQIPYSEKPNFFTHLTPKHWLLAAIVLLTTLLLWESKLLNSDRNAPDFQCIGKPTTTQPLTETQRKQLTQIREGTPKKTVQSQLPTPYCQLSNLSFRAGAVAQREVFQTSRSSWMVVMYEGDRFMGSRQVTQSVR